MSSNNQVNILTWNANSIKEKIDELKIAISNNYYDIVGISEARIDDKYKISTTGYKVYRSDRNSKGGGVALLVNNKIKHTHCILPRLQNIESVGIEVEFDKFKVVIVQVYVPQNKINNFDLNKIFSISNKVIVMGDFNSRRIEWNCFSNNKNGNILIDFCLNKNITIAAPDLPTHYPKVGRPSIIDFYLIKNCNNYSNPVTKQILNSDHNPVLLVLNEKILNIKKRSTLDFKNANWINFRKYIDKNINLNFHVKSRDDVDDNLKSFTNLINKAVELNIPIVNYDYNKRKFPQRIQIVLKLKNKYRRICQNYPCKVNKFKLNLLQNIVNSLIRKWNNNHWNKVIVNSKTKDGSLWKIVKRLTKKKTSIPPLYSNNSNILYSDLDKANVLVEQFCIHANHNNIPQNKYHDALVNNTVNKFIKNAEINFADIKLVTPQEVFNTVKLLKNKAAGYDGITGLILKNINHKSIVMLTKLLNGMLLTAHYPSGWKIAKVIPIPKPNKNISLPVSYRPISLLPCLSKVAEKIIKKRLDLFLNKNKILIDEQFGFRREHSTIDQLARFINDITKNFNEKKHTGAIFLDLEKAFDNVWHNGLIYKLIKLNFPIYLILLINSYIRRRQMFVEINGVKSIMHNIYTGVPQGTVLGPPFFLIYINDAPVMKDVKNVIFADNKGLYTQSFRIDTIINRLQKTAILTKKFFEKWKIKINSSKTEAIIFTKRRPHLNECIVIDGHKVLWSSAVKYLGLTLDKKLTFTNQINILTQKANALLISLYPLINRKSKLSLENKLILFKTIIRPILTYACPVWSFTSQTNFNTLQVNQNKFLRIIGNFRMFTPIFEMHNTLNIDMFQSHVKKLTINYFERIKDHNNLLIRSIPYNNISSKHKRIMHIINT